MKWVDDSEVLEGEIMDETSVTDENGTEICSFCDRVFDTHHSYTAHLRNHSDDLNNHVFKIISASKKSMKISEIQKLSGMTVGVRNSINRLIEQNKIRRVKQGFYAANKGIASKKEPVTQREASSVRDSLSNEWDSLVLAQLKSKHPDLYQRISNEVMAGIKKFIAFSNSGI